MKTILSRIDRFLAKHVFGPPIVALCRLTRHSPNEMAGALSIVASLTVAWIFLQKPAVAIFYTLAAAQIFVAVPIVYYTVFLRGIRYKPRPVMRLMLFIGLIVIATSLKPMSIAFVLLLIAAEYAAMIDTLPPRRKKTETCRGSRDARTSLRRTIAGEGA